MRTKFTVHGTDSKCPICGAEEGCYDGLRQGSEIKCGNCGTVMRVDGQEWCKYRIGAVILTALKDMRFIGVGDHWEPECRHIARAVLAHLEGRRNV